MKKHHQRVVLTFHSRLNERLSFLNLRKQICSGKPLCELHLSIISGKLLKFWPDSDVFGLNLGPEIESTINLVTWEMH